MEGNGLRAEVSFLDTVGAFLPRMDCFDYFDPRHGASRFPWSFKLFFSSSFSVWEEDWGDIVRKKKQFFLNWSVDRPKFAFPLTDSSDCPFWPYRSSRSPLESNRMKGKERKIHLARKHHRAQSKNPLFLDFDHLWATDCLHLLPQNTGITSSKGMPCSHLRST